MPGFKVAGKAPKASAKGAAHSGKASGGCGSGAGGFKPGNTCGHREKRNATVEAARKAHTAAKAEVLKHARAHTRASKAAAKAGGPAPAPKELHAAIKRSAAAHTALRDARDAHKATQRDTRNAARREARKAAKSPPAAPTPSPTGQPSQARPAGADRGSRNERLAVLAARHDRKAQALHAAAKKEYTAVGNSLIHAGKGNSHIEGPGADVAHAGADALAHRSGLHTRMAGRLRNEVLDPAKAAAGGRTLKSLAGGEAGSGRNRTVIRALGNGLTHAELKAAAGHAGIAHSATTKQGLVDHLAGNVGRAKGPTAPVKAGRPIPRHKRDNYDRRESEFDKAVYTAKSHRQSMARDLRGKRGVIEKPRAPEPPRTEPGTFTPKPRSEIERGTPQRKQAAEIERLARASGIGGRTTPEQRAAYVDQLRAMKPAALRHERELYERYVHTGHGGQRATARRALDMIGKVEAGRKTRK